MKPPDAKKNLGQVGHVTRRGCQRRATTGQSRSGAADEQRESATVKTKNPHRVFVVRELPLPVMLLIEYVRAILAAMANNAHFTTPNPPLATVTASASALESAQAVTKTRAPGSIALRDAARKQLLDQVHLLLGYVQQIADGSRDQAAAIIASAGLRAATRPTRVKAPFAVKPGTVSGSAHLSVKSAGPRAAYDWEFSIDGGKTWTSAGTTLQARTVVSGLAVATSVMFRFRAVIKGGPADWSQPLSLVVK